MNFLLMKEVEAPISGSVAVATTLQIFAGLEQVDLLHKQEDTHLYFYVLYKDGAFRALPNDERGRATFAFRMSRNDFITKHKMFVEDEGGLSIGIIGCLNWLRQSRYFDMRLDKRIFGKDGQHLDRPIGICNQTGICTFFNRLTRIYQDVDENAEVNTVIDKAAQVAGWLRDFDPYDIIPAFVPVTHKSVEAAVAQHLFKSFGKTDILTASHVAALLRLGYKAVDDWFNNPAYAVWVGGVEVNDFLVPISEAIQIAQERINDGYDDVKVEYRYL